MFRSAVIIPLIKRTFSSAGVAEISKYCAIIGSGPAGFYTAQGLLKYDKTNTHIHVFEKLPVPFGLVRYGVAPDHPDVKNVINKFTKTASHQHFRFFGNVELGKDMTIETLRKSYDAVVLCYGAGSEKTLNIPGEDSHGVFGAQSFVGWYNSLPRFVNLRPNFQCHNAVVIGHGNVAIDCARMMLTSPDELAKTDMSSEAVSALRSSKVKNVYLCGRRGPLQAAFTTAEFRELLNLADVSVQIDPAHFNGIREHLNAIPRPKRRCIELMLKHIDNQKPPLPDEKCLYLEFFTSPAEITCNNDKKVTGVRFNRTALVNPNDFSADNKVKILPGQELMIEAGLVVRSVGYRGICADPALPFDNQTGAIRNDEGRVRGLAGVYCAGWIGVGAVGVIANTLANASHVAKVISSDLANQSLSKTVEHVKEMARYRNDLLQQLEKRHRGTVDWEGWMKIDTAERKLAEKMMGKPREKITNVEEMIAVAKVAN